jgi:hypothetical protein
MIITNAYKFKSLTGFYYYTFFKPYNNVLCIVKIKSKHVKQVSNHMVISILIMINIRYLFISYNKNTHE